MKIKLLIIILITTGLSACGGGSNNSEDNEFTLTVSPSLKITLEEESKYTFSVKSTNKNLNHDKVSFTLKKPPELGVITGQYPLLTYTPHKDKFGKDNAIMTLSYQGTESLPINIDIDIKNVNDAPLLSGTPLNNELKLHDTFNFQPLITDSDKQHSSYQFTVENLPTWAEFDPETGAISGTPHQDSDIGHHDNIIIHVTDGPFSATLLPFSLIVGPKHWQYLTQLPSAYGSHLQAEATDNTLYTLSHSNDISSAMSCAGSTPTTPTFYSLSVDTLEWQKRASPPQSRYWFNMLKSGNALFLIGGTKECNSFSEPLATLDIYDLELGSWRSIDSHNFTPFENSITASCANNERVTLFSVKEEVNYVHHFIPQREEWHTAALTLTKYQVQDCVYQDEQLFVIRKSTDTQHVLEEYDIGLSQVIHSILISSKEDSFVRLSKMNRHIYIQSAQQFFMYNIDEQTLSTLAANPFAIEQQTDQTYYLRDFITRSVQGKHLQIGGRFTTQSLGNIYIFQP